MVRSLNPANLPRHKNPVPTAAMHHGLLVSSAIMGKITESDDWPATKEEQIALAFEHMQTLLHEAGANLQDVIKVDLYFADKSERPLVNPHWLALYPDEAHRPARHAHISELPKGCCLQIGIMAIVAQSK
ncbi:MAG: RidA family protein [Cohaesibacter sp.]|nr:RidA family protein [Cohaesibacter sp.]